ncbi:MAG TPA: hypothetical protein PLH12_00050 [Pseudomonadales bacterium]|nr:hypothetical protein [Pseudomonadales bacterium]
MNRSLAWRSIQREWRSGELGLLFAALVLGVAVVTGIDLFADRLQKALVGEAAVYLGADRVVQLGDPLPAAQLDNARQLSLQVAETITFPTMVYPSTNKDSSNNNDRSALVSLKAVSSGYPLRGTLELRDANHQTTAVQHGPADGMAWVDANILNQLDLTIGASIDIGNHSFVIDRVLTREGDAGSSFYGMGMRVMINAADLHSTGLLIPGSRAEYRYLFAGDAQTLDSYFAQLKPQLPQGARIVTLQDNQPGIASALDKATLFLRLAGSLGVLLAALATAFSAQRYCQRHIDAVAVLKTLGATRQQILSLQCWQLGVLWLLATAVGFAPALLLQQAFLYTMGDWIPSNLPPSSWQPFAMGAATSLVCLLAFTGPSFLRLVDTPPWRALRSDSGNNTDFRSLWPAIPGVALLLLLYSHSLSLTALLIGGTLMLMLLAGVSGWLLLRSGRYLSQYASNVWRLGIANILRQRWLSLLQITVFSIGFMLLAVMVLIRSSLLNEWKMQVPADAPNVFLINIAPDEVDRLRADLTHIHLAPAQLFPMVRGRLSTINGQRVTDLFDESVNAVYRDLNLSWSSTLPADNAITTGTWPSSAIGDAVPVSVEQGLARKLKLQLNDKLVFTIGGKPLSTFVASIRSVDWDRMTPNFYFLFPPNVLDKPELYNATWITSLYRSEAQEAVLSHLLRQYPAITAYPVDDLLARVQAIIERVSLAVEIILLLVLSAGLLVLLTCLRAGIDQKLHESALLRTLGAKKSLILGSLIVEFAVVGAIAGLLAAAGAELTAWALQTFLFKMTFVAHPWLWITTLATSTLLIGGAGTIFCYRVTATPPVIVLREFNPYS